MSRFHFSVRREAAILVLAALFCAPPLASLTMDKETAELVATAYGKNKWIRLRDNDRFGVKTGATVNVQIADGVYHDADGRQNCALILMCWPENPELVACTACFDLASPVAPVEGDEIWTNWSNGIETFRMPAKLEKLKGSSFFTFVTGNLQLRMKNDGGYDMEDFFCDDDEYLGLVAAGDDWWISGKIFGTPPLLTEN